MTRVLALAAAIGVAGCSEQEPTTPTAGAALERQAIERGVIRDPATTSPAGLYAREGDRICVVDNARGLRIGAFIDYGDGNGCVGGGPVRRRADMLDVTLGRGCRFDARFDGDRIVFAGDLPDACTDLCRGRASFAGFEAGRIEDGGNAALLTPDGRRLCAG